jgi:DNA-binding FadR family transcriptional regulator
LELICPSEDHLREMIGGYAFILNIPPEQLIEAWGLLHAVAARIVAAKMNRTKPAPSPWRLAAGVSTAGIVQLRDFGRELVAQSGSQLLQFLCAALAPLLPPVASQTMPIARLNSLQRRIQFSITQGDAAGAARRTRLLFTWNENAHLKSLRQHNGYTGLPTPRPQERASCRAMVIVQKLLLDLHPADWEKGRPLGNEFDLCDRYNVHRSVIRQAIRIMEDSETAMTLPGRGHGLVSSKPSSAPLSRQICNFLGSRRLPPADASEVAAGLQIEMAALAARKSTADDASLLNRLYEGLRHLGGSAPISCFQPFERWQLGLARNPLLNVFVDGAKSYLSWTMADELVAPHWIVSLYVERTCQVLDAIQRQDPGSATRMQEVKLETLQECRNILAKNRIRD